MALLRAALVGTGIFIACLMVGHTGHVPHHPHQRTRPTTTVTVAPTTTTTTTTLPPPPPPKASRGEAHRSHVGRRADPALPLRLRIRFCESTDRYDALNATSTASGGYQFLDATWRSWQAAYGDGRYYPRAYLAPPDLQDLVAEVGLARQGPHGWKASQPCWQ